MAAKKKNLTPTEVAKKDMDYMIKGAKQAKYLFDLVNLRVNVPMGEEIDCPMTKHLIDKFKFQVQFQLEDSLCYNKDIFDPEIRVDKLVESVNRIDPSTEPKWERQEDFVTRDGEHIQIKEVRTSGGATKLEMMYINSMKDNFTVCLFTAKINYNHKVWIYKPRRV